MPEPRNPPHDLGSNQSQDQPPSSAQPKAANTRATVLSDSEVQAGSLDMNIAVDAAQLVAAGSPMRAIARYQARMPEAVYLDARLEGNAYTLPEIRTLLEGEVPDGQRTEDTDQVINLAAAARLMVTMASQGPMMVSRAVSDAFNEVLTTHEVIEPGVVRGTGRAGGGGGWVNVMGARFAVPTPGPDGKSLVRLFDQGLAISQMDAPVPVQAAKWAAWATYHQFYSNGNKRTGRFVMNTILLSHGFDAILIPAKAKTEYEQTLYQLFIDTDPRPNVQFLLSNLPQNNA